MQCCNKKHLTQRYGVCRKHVRPFWLNVVIADIYDFIGRIFNLFPEISFENFDFVSSEDFHLIFKQHKKLNDYRKHIVNNTVLLQPSRTCSNRRGDPPFLLILVKSAVGNYASRDVIRRTWGANHTIVFILGTPRSLILLEYTLYNDILIVPSEDTYRNMATKVKSGLSWASSWCPNAKYTVLVDDDVVIFPSRIVSYLNKMNYIDNIPLYLGHVKSNVPHRSTYSKWYITFDEYPYDKYPDYVTGGCIVMSRAFMELVSIATPHLKDLFIDDIYLGIVAYKLGVAPTNIKFMPLNRILPSDEKYDVMLSSTGFHCTGEMQIAWDEFTLKQNGNNIDKNNVSIDSS